MGSALCTPCAGSPSQSHDIRACRAGAAAGAPQTPSFTRSALQPLRRELWISRRKDALPWWAHRGSPCPITAGAGGIPSALWINDRGFSSRPGVGKLQVQALYLFDRHEVYDACSEFPPRARSSLIKLIQSWDTKLKIKQNNPQKIPKQVLIPADLMRTQSPSENVPLSTAANSVVLMWKIENWGSCCPTVFVLGQRLWLHLAHWTVLPFPMGCGFRSSTLTCAEIGTCLCWYPGLGVGNSGCTSLHPLQLFLQQEQQSAKGPCWRHEVLSWDGRSS